MERCPITLDAQTEASGFSWVNDCKIDEIATQPDLGLQLIPASDEGIIDGLFEWRIETLLPRQSNREIRIDIQEHFFDLIRISVRYCLCVLGILAKPHRTKVLALVHRERFGIERAHDKYTAACACYGNIESILAPAQADRAKLLAEDTIGILRITDTKYDHISFVALNVLDILDKWAFVDLVACLGRQERLRKASVGALGGGQFRS